MADTPDSKSGGVNPREGSSPASGTSSLRLMLHPNCALSISSNPDPHYAAPGAQLSDALRETLNL